MNPMIKVTAVNILKYINGEPVKTPILIAKKYIKYVEESDNKNIGSIITTNDYDVKLMVAETVEEIYEMMQQ